MKANKEFTIITSDKISLNVIDAYVINLKVDHRYYSGYIRFHWYLQTNYIEIPNLNITINAFDISNDVRDAIDNLINTKFKQKKIIIQPLQAL